MHLKERVKLSNANNVDNTGFEREATRNEEKGEVHICPSCQQAKHIVALFGWEREGEEGGGEKGRKRWVGG